MRKVKGNNSCNEWYKKFNEKPGVKWSNGDFRVRFHVFKLPNCEKELRKNLSSKGNRPNQKGDEMY